MGLPYLVTRKYAQYLFLLFNIYVGVTFYMFYRYFESGGQTAFFGRPPSVEAFLPIAALMGLKYFLTTGIYDPVHPAGLTILIAALLSAVILKRGFCSWICPIGTVSEALYKIGGRIALNLKLPRFLDIPLRSLKYLILGFLVFAVAAISNTGIAAFMASPFNAVADIRLLVFFTNPSTTTITVLLSFVLFSLIIKNFWCRYLCPYGALLGLASKAGLVAVNRDTAKCTDCKSCERACPSYIKITKREKVGSAECTQCFECLAACPEKALSLKPAGVRKAIKPTTYGLTLVGGFLLLVVAAQVTGRWETNITLVEYGQLIPEASRYMHP